MEPHTTIVSAQLDDETTVKISATALGGEEDVVDLKQILPFKQVTDAIEGVGRMMLATLERVKPNKASIEFGVEVAIESGALTALIVKGSGTGNLKVTLEWERKQD